MPQMPGTGAAGKRYGDTGYGDLYPDGPAASVIALYVLCIRRLESQPTSAEPLGSPTVAGAYGNPTGFSGRQ